MVGKQPRAERSDPCSRETVQLQLSSLSGAFVGRSARTVSPACVPRVCGFDSAVGWDCAMRRPGVRVLPATLAHGACVASLGRRQLSPSNVKILARDLPHIQRAVSQLATEALAGMMRLLSGNCRAVRMHAVSADPGHFCADGTASGVLILRIFSAVGRARTSHAGGHWFDPHRRLVLCQVRGRIYGHMPAHSCQAGRGYAGSALNGGVWRPAGPDNYICARLRLCELSSGRSMCHGRLRGGPCWMCVNAEC